MMQDIFADKWSRTERHSFPRPAARGEGAEPTQLARRVRGCAPRFAPHPIARCRSRSTLSPQAGRGEVRLCRSRSEPSCA
jgi:hypothetical protein